MTQKFEKSESSCEPLMGPLGVVCFKKTYVRKKSRHTVTLTYAMYVTIPFFPSRFISFLEE